MKALKLRIVHDSCPENPFENWDGICPLMFEAGRGANEDYSKGDIHNHIAKQITEGRAIRHQEFFAELFGLDLEGMSKDEKADEIIDAIFGANMEELTSICEKFLIPHLNTSSAGYFQGDYAELLIVPTDEFYRVTGADKKRADEQMKHAKELFDAYMWGDVYGFEVIEVTTCECCEGESEEVIDSCFGFYGSGFETNGIKDYIPEELHDQLKEFDISDVVYRY